MRAHSDTAPGDDLRLLPDSKPPVRGVHFAAFAAASKTPSQWTFFNIAPAKLVRIHLQQKRQLIDGLLGCKRKREIQRRAKPRAFQVAEPRHVMIHQAHVGNIVHSTAAERIHLHRGIGLPFGGGFSERQLLGSLHVAPMMLPAVIFVSDDFSIRACGRANFAHVRWPVVIPAMLVPAHELDAHRLCSQLREQRGGLGHVVVTTVPVGARTLVILHADFVHRQSQDARQRAARAIDILR